MKISLQLYSIKDEIAADFKGAVKKVGELGYDGVEFAGFGGLTADEMKTLLAESNLYSVGSHSGMDIFKNSFEECCAYNKAIGSQYVIMPWAQFKTREDVDEVINLLNSSVEIARKYGLKVGYHNHAFEFEKIDGEYILDLIAANTSDDVVLEVDVFWAAVASVDPLAYIEKWGKKIELIHIKQIGAENKNVEISKGNIDMKKVIETAKYAKHFSIEQEASDIPIWEITKNNVEYMKSL